MQIQYPSQWLCTFTDNGVVDTSSTCNVTATTTYTIQPVQATSTDSVPYGDWLFSNMIIIFLLALMAGGTIMRFIFPIPKI